MKTVEIAVDDMTCGHCVSTVKSALSVVEGVEDVDVELEGKRARVRADDGVSEDRLLDAVRQAGYTPALDR